MKPPGIGGNRVVTADPGSQTGQQVQGIGAESRTTAAQRAVNTPEKTINALITSYHFQGFIEGVCSTLSGRWLHPAELCARRSAPFQLRLLFPLRRRPVFATIPPRSYSTEPSRNITTHRGDSCVLSAFPALPLQHLGPMLSWIPTAKSLPNHANTLRFCPLHHLGDPGKNPRPLVRQGLAQDLRC